jgi:hypothetical protein
MAAGILTQQAENRLLTLAEESVKKFEDIVAGMTNI